MRRIVFATFIALVVCVLWSCVQTRAGQKAHDSVPDVWDTVSYKILGKVENSKIYVNKDIDLKKSVCELPKGVTLVFDGGVIKNGILVGNKTKLIGKRKAFDRVNIRGTWNVPEISTKLFADLSYVNALCDVVALSAPNINNIIIIEKGKYKVRATKNSEACLDLHSNTHLILHGSVQIEPNEFSTYMIIQANGENIRLSGEGAVIGDKHNHIGDKGEWGMGISMKNARNVTVSGLTIKDCWGDCIYVGKKSNNILIEKCELVHGRRQGISITGGDNIIIRHCKITDVGGTNPQYAIDIEPNSKDSCNHILIDNVEIENCVGGIVVTKVDRKDKPSKAWIGSVSIKNCTVSTKEKYPLRIRSGVSAIIEGNTFYSTNEKPAVYLNDVDTVTITNNTIKLDNKLLFSFKNNVKRIAGKSKYRPIKTVRAITEKIENNVLNE